jgi:hypothetical protein
MQLEPAPILTHADKFFSKPEFSVPAGAGNSGSVFANVSPVKAPRRRLARERQAKQK